MIVSAAVLRRDLYRLLDDVLESGVPLEVERNGRRLRIVPVAGASKFSRLRAHPGTIVGDPEDFVHLDWSEEWRPWPAELTDG